MNPTHTLRTVALAALAAAALALAGCARPADEHAHEDAHGHDAHAEAGHDDHAERGPHGGRLFEDGDVRLELAIEEDGIPPEFRAWLLDAKGGVLDPAGARFSVVLERFAGRRDSLSFRVEGDRLRSNGTVDEPHSFVARLALERGGRAHAWEWEQREGRVELAPQAVTAGGIAVGEAGPRRIEVRVEAPGEVKLNAERVVQVRPRFAGVVRRLLKRLGDAVAPGDVLAVVGSNESLADYEITASMAGTVVSRDLAEGQLASPETVLYTIADLSSVWVDFALYPRIAGQVRRGQPVTITTEAGPPMRATGAVHYVGPLLEQDTRVSYARVVLPNPRRDWQPGLFVSAAIAVDRVQAAVAVPEEAIVRTTRGPAVFRADGATFELQPVTPGRTDGTWTEIVEGLAAGDSVVVRNAFLLKAELGKSEATHDH